MMSLRGRLLFGRFLRLSRTPNDRLAVQGRIALLAERGAREAVALNGPAQSRVYSLCLGQINPRSFQVGHPVLERGYLPGVILDRPGVLGEAGYRKPGQDVAALGHPSDVTGGTNHAHHDRTPSGGDVFLSAPGPGESGDLEAGRHEADRPCRARWRLRHGLCGWQDVCVMDTAAAAAASQRDAQGSERGQSECRDNPLRCFPDFIMTAG